MFFWLEKAQDGRFMDLVNFKTLSWLLTPRSFLVKKL